MPPPPRPRRPPPSSRRSATRRPARAARAEDALAAAVAESKALSDALAHTAQTAHEERAALEQRADAAERRWADASARVEDLSQQRAHLQSERTRADEQLAAALHEKRSAEAQLQDERMVSQHSAKREGNLRHQLEAAEWALHTSQQTAAAIENERAVVEARAARLQTQLDIRLPYAAAAASPTSPARATGAVGAAPALNGGSPVGASPPLTNAYYLAKATEAYYASLRQREMEFSAAKAVVSGGAGVGVVPPPASKASPYLPTSPSYAASGIASVPTPTRKAPPAPPRQRPRSGRRQGGGRRYQPCRGDIAGGGRRRWRGAADARLAAAHPLLAAARCHARPPPPPWEGGRQRRRGSATRPSSHRPSLRSRAAWARPAARRQSREGWMG